VIIVAFTFSVLALILSAMLMVITIRIISEDLDAMRSQVRGCRDDICEIKDHALKASTVYDLEDQMLEHKKMLDGIIDMLVEKRYDAVDDAEVESISKKIFGTGYPEILGIMIRDKMRSEIENELTQEH
jgi:hypothetical protein